MIFKEDARKEIKNDYTYDLDKLDIYSNDFYQDLALSMNKSQQKAYKFHKKFLEGGFDKENNI